MSAHNPCKIALSTQSLSLVLLDSRHRYCLCKRCEGSDVVYTLPLPLQSLTTYLRHALVTTMLLKILVTYELAWQSALVICTSYSAPAQQR